MSRLQKNDDGKARQCIYGMFHKPLGKTRVQHAERFDFLVIGTISKEPNMSLDNESKLLETMKLSPRRASAPTIISWELALPPTQVPTWLQKMDKARR